MASSNFIHYHICRAFATLLVFSGMAIALSSCGGGGSLEKQKEELQKLREKRIKLNDQISQLEKEIVKVDSSIITPKKKERVTALKVQTEEFSSQIEFQGSALSDENINISPEAGGQIVKRNVNVGSRVSRGQLLFQLDNDIIMNNIQELNTALELATAVHKRQKNLWDQNIGSEIQYLEAKNNKENLERKLATAYSQYAKSEILAPISGVVDEVYAHKGEMASPGRPLARIINVSKIKVEAEVSEAYINSVSAGMQVGLYFPAIDLTTSGKIGYIGQQIHPNNRTFKVTVEMDNSDRRVKPNLLAKVRISEGGRQDALTVPTRLIQNSKGRQFVFKVVDDPEHGLVAGMQIIKTGKTSAGKTVVTEGLNEGDLLVDEGFRQVSDGSPIKLAKGK